MKRAFLLWAAAAGAITAAAEWPSGRVLQDFYERKVKECEVTPREKQRHYGKRQFRAGRALTTGRRSFTLPL